VIQVIKAASLNCILSYLVFLLYPPSGYDLSLTDLVVMLMIGGPYSVILLGFSPIWFEYKGDSVGVKISWFSALVPFVPLGILFWLFGK
jgi:hypothetical protein